jgi:hypothetical protein
MRYEKPECVLLGEAKAVVLGGPFSLDPENLMSSKHGDLLGYDE